MPNITAVFSAVTLDALVPQLAERGSPRKNKVILDLYHKFNQLGLPLSITPSPIIVSRHVLRVSTVHNNLEARYCYFTRSRERIDAEVTEDGPGINIIFSGRPNSNKPYKLWRGFCNYVKSQKPSRLLRVR